MLLRIPMKTPDALDCALQDIDDEDERDQIKRKLDKWFKYGECVDLVYDTESDTLKVV